MAIRIKEFFMAKKSSKVILTYIITIVLTLIITAGICYVAFSSILFGGKNDKEEETPANSIELQPMTVLGDYTPSAEDARTVLLILDAEKRESGSCFLIARFVPTEEQFVFLPIPSNTSISSGEGEDTIYNIYRNGGTKKAVEAAESCFGLKIDKYIKFNRSSFSVIADLFGGIDYDIPYNLVYDNPDTGEATVFKSGRQFLDSTSLRKVLTYPNYTQGEEYRSKCLGVAVNDLVTKGTSNGSSFANNLDDYFVAVINADIDTDITAYDYDEVKKAMKYVIKNSERISALVLSSGTQNEDGHYVIDEKFLATLPELLSLEENAQSAE